MGLIHLTHAADTEAGNDFVRTESGAGRRGHETRRLYRLDAWRRAASGGSNRVFLREMRTAQILLLTTCVAISSLSAAGGLKVGDSAPQFSLPGSDGKSYSLASYKGK